MYSNFSTRLVYMLIVKNKFSVDWVWAEQTNSSDLDLFLHF